MATGQIKKQDIGSMQYGKITFIDSIRAGRVQPGEYVRITGKILSPKAVLPLGRMVITDYEFIEDILIVVDFSATSFSPSDVVPGKGVQAIGVVEKDPDGSFFIRAKLLRDMPDLDLTLYRKSVNVRRLALAQE